MLLLLTKMPGGWYGVFSPQALCIVIIPVVAKTFGFNKFNSPFSNAARIRPFSIDLICDSPPRAGLAHGHHCANDGLNDFIPFENGSPISVSGREGKVISVSQLFFS
jgi:hypothetical protein